MEGQAGGDRDLLESNVSAHARFPTNRGGSPPPSADLSPGEEDLPGARMLGLIFLTALLVACGVVRATVYVLTGF